MITLLMFPNQGSLSQHLQIPGKKKHSFPFIFTHFNSADCAPTSREESCVEEEMRRWL